MVRIERLPAGASVARYKSWTILQVLSCDGLLRVPGRVLGKSSSVRGASIVWISSPATSCPSFGITKQVLEHPRFLASPAVAVAGINQLVKN